MAEIFIQPSSYDEVKDLQGCCISCGLLSKYALDDWNRFFYEANPSERLNSNYYQQYNPTTFNYFDTRPACMVNAAALNKEIEERKNDPAELHAGLAITMKDRKCPHWFPYQQGFSPREHLEQQRQEKSEKRAETLELRQQRIEIFVGVAAILLGAAQVIAALL